MGPTSEWEVCQNQIMRVACQVGGIGRIFLENMICLRTKIQKQASEDYTLSRYQKIHWEILDSFLAPMGEN